MNQYQQYLHELEMAQNQLSQEEKDEIEKQIFIKLKKNRIRSKGGYFNLHDLLEIDEVKKHFDFLIINSDRNIGKSYAMRSYCKAQFLKDRTRSMWVRNMKTSTDSVIEGDQFFWQENKGWDVLKNAMQVIVKKNYSNMASSGNKADIVMWYSYLKGSHMFKSTQYEKCNIICYDEFNDGSKIHNKLGLLSSLASTVFRGRKNTILILASNYIDQGDPILVGLGMKQGKGKVEELTFNWITKALVWNVPKNTYTTFGKSLSLERRIALTAGFQAWNSQYGGKYENETNYNILDKSHFDETVDLWYLYLPKYREDSFIKLVYGRTLQNNKKVYHYLINADKKPQKNLPEFSLNENERMSFIKSKRLSPVMYNKLKKLWINEKLFTDDLITSELIITMLSNNFMVEPPLIEKIPTV